MSISSNVIKRILKLTNANKPISEKQFYKELRKNAIVEYKGENINKLLLSCKVESAVYCGMKYFVFIPKKIDTDSVVLYLHGSGYMNPHNRAQERFADYLAKNLHAKVYFPIYPKLPSGNARTSYAVINNFYEYLNRISRVMLVGDSSGASLALALASAHNQAEYVVAISPWLDIAFPNLNDRDDLMFSMERLRNIAKLWVYDLPYDNEKVSPIYGDYNNKNILLIVGSEEIFCEDARKFMSQNKEKANVTYIEGEGQFHDYLLMPTQEGRDAREQAVNFLQNAIYKR